MTRPSTLDAMRREGRLTATGEFGLDRKKAREKLQKYQLKDPHHYVLELVQAAHLLGASRIAIAIDADEMEMVFDGEALRRDELEGLYDAAFSRRVDARAKALRHLAIGVTAARALEPSVLRVESSLDDQGLVLELADDEELLRSVGPIEIAGSMRIYLREKLRASHLLEFFRNLRGDLAEKVALREYCAHSPLRIELDGERISSGYALGEEVVDTVEFETTQERGVIGLTPRGHGLSATVLQNGVKVVEHHVPDAVVAARAIIDSDRLTKDLSRSAFVEDAAWTSFVTEVLPTALLYAVYRRVSTFDDEAARKNRSWLRYLCDELLPDAVHAARASDERQRRELGHLLEGLSELGEYLRAQPLWQAIDGRWLSIDELADDDAPIYYTLDDQFAERLERYDRVFHFVDESPPVFARLFGERLVDLTPSSNLKRWRSTPWPDELSDKRCAVLRRFEGGSMRAAVGLCTADEVRSQFVWVKDGHLFERSFPYHVREPVRLVQFNGDLPTNVRFDDIEPNAEYTELALSVMQAWPELVIERPDLLEPSEVRAFLDNLLSEGVHMHLLEELRVGTADRLRWVSQHRKRLSESPWSLAYHPPSNDPDNPPSIDEIRGRLGLLGPLVDVPAFHGNNQEAFSLRDLLDSVDANGKLWLAARSTHVLQSTNWRDRIDRVARQVDGVLVLGNAADKEILERLFGAHVGDAKPLVAKATLEDLTEFMGPDEPSRRSEEEQEGRGEARIEAQPTDEPTPPDEPAEVPAQPEPPTAPTPPEARPATPEERLLERLEAQLLRAGVEDKRLGALAEAVDLDHPAAAYAIERPDDPVALAFASATAFEAIASEEAEAFERAEFYTALTQLL
jgi:hypothetical protein